MNRPFTLADKIASVRREIVWRRKVYPGRVQNGRMSTAKAQREIACMEAILADLEAQQRQQEPRRLL